MERTQRFDVAMRSFGFIILAPAMLAGMQAAAAGPNGLSKEDRAQLALAEASGKGEVAVLILAGSDGSARLVPEIKALGGSIRFREDAVGYLRAVVPITRIEELAAHPGIEMLNLVSPHTFRLSAEDPNQPKPAARLPWENPPMAENRVPLSGRAPAPTRDSLESGGYLPLARHEVPQFLQRHPTYDGRGVVVTIVDGFFDPLTPELQWAKDIEGRDVPKIIDIRAVDAENISDAPVVAIELSVSASGGRTHYRGRSYRLPAGVPLRIGTFEPAKLSSLQGRLSAFDVAVVWDEAGDRFWVDTDGDFDFTDEAPLVNTPERLGRFVIGVDDPNTPVRESAAFSLIREEGRRNFRLLHLSGGHGGMVAATLAARGYMGGSQGGMAPNTQLIGFGWGGGNMNHVGTVGDAFVAAMRDPRVDLVSTSSPHRMPFIDRLADRLVERFRKPLIMGAGNSGGKLSSLIPPASSRHTLAVGGYVPRESWWANMGVRVEEEDYVAPYSARGPSPDGGLKPDVLGLTHVFTAYGNAPCCQTGASAWLASPDYRVGAGTSQAQPSAAGAVALLISAAKQTGVAYDPWRLRQALRESARPIARYGAHDQGYGVIQIDKAWDALRNLKAEPLDIEISAPVATWFASERWIAPEGRGLYERENWKVGDRRGRTMMFRRQNGPEGSVRYGLRWRQNDGTFSSPHVIDLPRGSAVPLDVNVAPKASGAHSAILELVDPISDKALFATMATIIAAEDFIAKQGFAIRHDGRVERPGNKSYFVRVPPGVEALALELEIVEGTAKLQAFGPEGKFAPLPAPGMSPAGGLRWLGPGRTHYVVPRPVAGVWEIMVQADSDWMILDPQNPDPTPPTEYVLKTSIHAVDVKVSGDGMSASATNKLAPIDARLVAGLATRATRKVRLTAAERRRSFELSIPPGTGQLIVNARTVGGSGDVDVYLFDLNGKEPELVIKAFTRDGAERIVLDRPKSGRWRVMLDLASSEHSVDIDYEDEFVIQRVSLDANAAQGAFAVRDPIRHRPSNDRWKAVIHRAPGDLSWVPEGRIAAIRWTAIDPHIGLDTDPVTLGMNGALLEQEP